LTRPRTAPKAPRDYSPHAPGAPPEPTGAPTEPTSIVPEPAFVPTPRTVSAAPAYTRARVAEAEFGDLTIPGFLDRRSEVCAQCGAAGDAEGAVADHDLGGVRIRLHPQCHRYLTGHPEAAQETIDRAHHGTGRQQ
jgi:hypothetical protein